MTNSINGRYNSIIQAADSIGKSGKSTSNVDYEHLSFEEVLKNADSIEKVIDKTSNTALNKTIRFSKHAGERLEERDIHLSPQQLKRLEDGTTKADEKGIKDSLVLMDNMAFIVNVQNRTVITAMNSNSNEENIYTNIDGAVIV